MRKCLLVTTVSIVLVLVLLNNMAAFAVEQKVNLIPPKYSLTFDQAMQLFDDCLLIKCLRATSYYNKADHTGYAVSGSGYIDNKIGSCTWQVFEVPPKYPAITGASATVFKWQSSNPSDTGQGDQYTVESKIGLNCVQVTSYRNGREDKHGKFYLKTVPKVTEHKTEIVKSISRAEKLVNMFAQGQSAEALFQIADSVSLANKTGVKIGTDNLGTESSTETTYANTTTKALRVGVKDDGKSLMFPAQQKVRVLTITERIKVNKQGEAVKEITLDKSEELLLTIQKVRPNDKGEYTWQSK